MRAGTLAKLAAGLFVSAAVVAWATPARAECGILGTNQTLYTNQTLQSCDGRFTLAMQGDGNLVVYEGGHALWANYRFGSNARLVMQGDGNLVVYDGNNNALWATYKFGSNARLAMQTDGNLVVYDGGGNVLWASMVYYRAAVLQNLAAAPADDCPGRCGAGCNGWMPFGGNVYTGACAAHDACVAQHGHVGCIPEFIPAAVSYVATTVWNLLSSAWDAITSFFDWW